MGNVVVSHAVTNRTLRNLYYWHHATGWRAHKDYSVLDVPTKVLIHGSSALLRMLIGIGFAVHEQPICFNHALTAFVVEATWRYLSDHKRDRSERLPPLRSLIGLRLNEGIYEPEIEFLERLRIEYGLVILHPLWIESLLQLRLDSPMNFKFFGDEFFAFNNWLNEKDNEDDQEYPWYMKCEFILAMLRDRDYFVEFAFDLRESLYFTQRQFEATVRSTMLYFWDKNKTGHVFERLAVGLMNSNALEIMLQNPSLSPALDGYISILAMTESETGNISTLHRSEVVLTITKSIYYWFIEFAEAESKEVLRRFPMKVTDPEMISIVFTLHRYEWWHSIDGDALNRQRYLDMVGSVARNRSRSNAD